MTWRAGIWVSGICKRIPWQRLLLVRSHWHMCESGTGAPGKCRLLKLTVPFPCPALYPNLKV